MSVARSTVRVVRYAWSLPNSVLGAMLVVAGLASGGRAAIVDGVLEAHGGVLAPMLRRFVPLRGGASAMTLGHVVVGRDHGCLERTRAHEHAHVRQYECWGVFFLPAYMVASVAALAAGRHYYRDNVFERQAREAATACEASGAR